jgi:glucose uptake protein GlcU
MSLLVWTMMAIAVWHFTVFVPDRFWGGIVGAFVGAILGAIVFGLIVAGFSIPGDSETNIAQALIAIPGSALGLAACYAYGVRTETAS